MNGPSSADRHHISSIAHHFLAGDAPAAPAAGPAPPRAVVAGGDPPGPTALVAAGLVTALAGGAEAGRDGALLLENPRITRAAASCLGPLDRRPAGRTADGLLVGPAAAAGDGQPGPAAGALPAILHLGAVRREDLSLWEGLVASGAVPFAHAGPWDRLVWCLPTQASVSRAAALDLGRTIRLLGVREAVILAGTGHGVLDPAGLSRARLAGGAAAVSVAVVDWEGRTAGPDLGDILESLARTWLLPPD